MILRRCRVLLPIRRHGRDFPPIIPFQRGAWPLVPQHRRFPLILGQRRVLLPIRRHGRDFASILFQQCACPLIRLRRRRPFPSVRPQPHLTERASSAIVPQPYARVPLDAPGRRDLIERTLQLTDLGSGDPLRSTRLGERRSLAHDVGGMLDLIRRCPGPSHGAGIVQGHFGAVQFGRRERTHAWRAACPLERHLRLIHRRMSGRRSTTGDEGQEEKNQGSGMKRERALAQDTHRAALGSDAAAARRDAAVLLFDPLA